MKWREIGGNRHLYDAKAGHLYALITRSYGDEFWWFLCPDDEDKCDERAFSSGTSDTIEHAMQDCWHGAIALAKQIYLDIGAEGLLMELHRKL